MAKREEVSSKLDSLMLAFLCIKDVAGLPAQVAILDKFGLGDADISKVCGAALGSVRNARLAVKKQGQNRRRVTQVAAQNER